MLRARSSMTRQICLISLTNQAKQLHKPSQERYGKQMSSKANRIRRDRRALLKALGVDIKALSPDLLAVLETMSEEILCLGGQMDELKLKLSDAELLADHDTLCPVFNRRAFEREVRREIALAGRFGSPLCLIFIDLDNFKQVNDLYGHAAGDDVLVQISQILIQTTRNTDIVGRLGGDEFGIVLAHATRSASQEKARELTDLIDAIIVCGPAGDDTQPITIGASCGVVEWQEGDDDTRLIARADKAMFAEKARRRARTLPHTNR